MANWIRAAQARADTFADADFIGKARGDNLRLCTALLEAVEALERASVAWGACGYSGGCNAGGVHARANGGKELSDADCCPKCYVTRVLTRIQADPEVSRG